MKQKVAFLGAGSHADAVLPILDLLQYEFIGFFDDKNIDEHDGYPVLGKIVDVLEYLRRGQIDYIFVTIGDNEKRKEIFDYVAKDYYNHIMNIISPKATVLTADSIRGRGIFIGYGAFIGSKVELYDNSIVNTGAIIEHHTKIDSHCNITPNATLNGFVNLGECVYIGSGSVTIQMINIAPHTIVGAGAVVVKSIEEAGTYIGVPARKLK